MANSWVIKAQTSPDKFLSSSVNVIEQGTKRPKERPFNYLTAVNQFRGWIYAAVMMNAKAIAATPLRLYTRKKSGTKLYTTRNVRKATPGRYRYMLGEKRTAPSSGVIQKATEWGGEFEEVMERHPITQLLSNPNPSTRGFEFSCMRHIMGALTGNTYIHPVVESLRSGGDSMSRIKELWLMPSQYVKIVPAAPSEGDMIAGYQYGIIATQMKYYPKDEVFQQTFPNPKDMMYGLGPLEADYDAQKITIAQRETDQSRYDNLSRPDLAVITKSASNVTNINQMKELQEEWARLFRGTFRQGSPVFLTGDTSVVPLNWMPTEQGDREIIIEEHAAVFGVPVSMLKANDPNLASAQVGFASWRENTILPYCRMDEEFLNHFILPAFGLGEDAFLCYDDPVPENRDEVRQDIVAALQNGYWTRNEARAKLGDDPIDEENADKLLVPSGLTPIEKVGEPLSMGGFSIGGQDGQGNGGTGRPDDSDNGGGNRDANGGGTDNADNNTGTDDDASSGGTDGTADKSYPRSQLHREGDEKTIVQLSAHGHTCLTKGNADDTEREGESEKVIRRMTNKLNAVFALQRRDVVAVLSGQKAAGGLDLAKMISIIREYDGAIAEAIQPFITAQLVNGGGAAMAAISLPADTFNVSNPKVAEFVRGYTIRLAGEVNGYTAQQLSDTLAEGLDAGEPPARLAVRVNELYDEFDGYRSEMIARTESARAYSAGNETAWAESGVVKAKKWQLAAGGCPVCGQIAKMHPDGIPLGQSFVPLGAVIPLPDGGVFKVNYSAINTPPGHPHCLLPGTKVIARDVIAAMRANYSGRAIKVRFASGAVVSVTENHRFLTPQGFIAAKLLGKGSYVLGGVDGQMGTFDRGNPNDYDRPTVVDEVFNSLIMSRSVVSRGVPVSPEHLHGDGLFCKGDVDVVWTDGLLRYAHETETLKHNHQLPLCAAWDSLKLDGLSDLDAMQVGLSLASHGIMGGLAPSLALIGGGKAHACEHGFTSITPSETCLLEPIANGAAADTETISGLLNRFSGLVALNQVVDVDGFNYSGHVYDLQTSSGIYNCNGVYTSNCRCGMTAVLED